MKIKEIYDYMKNNFSIMDLNLSLNNYKKYPHCYVNFPKRHKKIINEIYLLTNRNKKYMLKLLLCFKRKNIIPKCVVKCHILPQIINM
jgi:hypothetical protein